MVPLTLVLTIQVDIKDGKGRTALQIATQNDNKKLVHCLLDAGAVPLEEEAPKDQES